MAVPENPEREPQDEPVRGSLKIVINVQSGCEPKHFSANKWDVRIMKMGEYFFFPNSVRETLHR